MNEMMSMTSGWEDIIRMTPDQIFQADDAQFKAVIAKTVNEGFSLERKILDRRSYIAELRRKGKKMTPGSQAKKKNDAEIALEVGVLGMNEAELGRLQALTNANTEWSNKYYAYNDGIKKGVDLDWINVLNMPYEERENPPPADKPEEKSTYLYFPPESTINHMMRLEGPKQQQRIKFHNAVQGLKKALYDTINKIAEDIEEAALMQRLAELFRDEFKYISRYEVLRVVLDKFKKERGEEGGQFKWVQYWKDTYFRNIYQLIPDSANRPAVARAHVAFKLRRGVCQNWAGAFAILANAIDPRYNALIIKNADTNEPHEFVRTNNPELLTECTFSDPMNAKKHKILLFRSAYHIDQVARTSGWGTERMYEISDADASWKICEKRGARFLDPLSNDMNGEQIDAASRNILGL